MEFSIDKIQVQCRSIAAAKGDSGRMEVVALELELPQSPALVHQVVLSFRVAMLVQHIEVARLEAARPASITAGADASSPWAAESAAAHVRPTKSSGGGPFQRLMPLVLAQRAGGRALAGAAAAAGPSGAEATASMAVYAYGVCQGPLHVTLRCTAPAEDADRFMRVALAALPSAQDRAAPAVERANASMFSFLLRHALQGVRVEAMSLARAPITAAQLVPLLNAAQHLRSAGAAHRAEAAEVDLLAGLALMRSRKFVQCMELWQRCACYLLEAAGVTCAPRRAAPSEVEGQRGPARLEAQASLGCGLSISPFAHRISASCDANVQRAIFLQVLIADCMIEHSGGPLHDRNLSAVLAALHLATQLHLVDLQVAPAPRLRPLDTPHDAQTVLSSLQPHLVHVLCAVVSETLRVELATQWCQVAASALRCLDFVVQTCISCAFEPLVIDTVVQCFVSCDARPSGQAAAASAGQAAGQPEAAAAAQALPAADGRRDLQAALHHLVETCHDVLPSISTATLQQAARRLVERLLGSQGQRRWPPLHIHLLRLLMRIAVLSAGDVAPSLVSGFGLHTALGTSEGTLPFFDYLLRLLCTAAAEERAGGAAGAADASAAEGEQGGGLGMAYVAQRCWGILRTHLLPFMPRQDLRLFIRWLASSLSDSRSSYPAARSLLLAVISDLAIAAGPQGEPRRSRGRPGLAPGAGGGANSEGVLRVHRAVPTVSGSDLQPLIRPLHDWLLLLASKRDAFHNHDNTAEAVPPLDPSTPLSARTPHTAYRYGDPELAVGLAGYRMDGGIVRGQWRLLSQGLLPSPHPDDVEDQDGSLDNSSEDADAEAWRRLPGMQAHRPEPGHTDVVQGKHWESWRARQLVGEFTGSHDRQAAADVPGNDAVVHAQQLLLVWQTLVELVDALPVACRPSLHTLARPVLEQVSQACLQGSPPKQALRITLSVLQDLEPCDDSSAPFLKSLLLTFCEWIPHSVLDETFAVLDQMLRLIGRVGLDEKVTFALTHSMLDQYTTRSKAHRRSQRAFVDLLMARRPLHGFKGTAAEASGPAEASRRSPPELSPRQAAAGSRQPCHPRGRGDQCQPSPSTCEGNSAEQCAQDGARAVGLDGDSDAEEDVSHFKDIVQLCFLGGGPRLSQSDSARDAAQPAQQPGSLDAACPSTETDGAIPKSAAASAVADDLDLVARMQFLCSVFHAMRYPHLIFVVEHLPEFMGALRIYVTHALEKVRLLGVELLQSICGTAFVRYSRRWAGGRAGDGEDLQRWWRLLEEGVDIAVTPLKLGGQGADIAADLGFPGFSDGGSASVGCHDTTAVGEAFDHLVKCHVPPIGTPAVMLACCSLLHVLRLSTLLTHADPASSASTAAGAHARALTERLVAPLACLARAPWRVPRAAGLSALLAWAPCLAWGGVRNACSILEAAINDGIRCSDCLGRCMALQLVPTLLRHQPNLPGTLREAILSLREDWSEDVRDVVRAVVPLLPGPDGMPPSGPLQRNVEEPSSIMVPRIAPQAAYERETPLPLGAAAVWGDALWESVYVNELPVACHAGAICRCTLDRFEDFLDGSDHASHRRELGKERPGGRFSPVGGAKIGRKIDPDPELGALLNETGSGGGGGAGDTEGGGLVDGQILPQGDSEEESSEIPGSSAHHVDDLENEEDLGIIDAGDEEWVELFDVIREHSAVTIFNHTDSTWYVSSRHPNLVRPLHGKRRHPLLQQRQRSPSPPSIGIVSERSIASSPRPWPRRSEQSRAGSGHRNVRLSAVGGEHAASAASLLACMDGRRRPHSAPNRVSAAHLAAPEGRRFNSVVLGSQWTPQRTGRSSRAALMAPQWQAERPFTPEGQAACASGTWPCSSSDRPGHSAMVEAWSEAPQPQPRRGAATCLAGQGMYRRDLTRSVDDYSDSLGSHSWRASSPPVSEDAENDFIVEEDGGSSSSGLSAVQPNDELQRTGESLLEDSCNEALQVHGSGRSPVLGPRMVVHHTDTILHDCTSPSGRRWAVPPLPPAAGGEEAGRGAEELSPRSLGEARLPPAAELEDVEEAEEEGEVEAVAARGNDAWLSPHGVAEEEDLDAGIDGELEGDIGGPG